MVGNYRFISWQYHPSYIVWIILAVCRKPILIVVEYRCVMDDIHVAIPVVENYDRNIFVFHFVLLLYEHNARACYYFVFFYEFYSLYFGVEVWSDYQIFCEYAGVYRWHVVWALNDARYLICNFTCFHDSCLQFVMISLSLIINFRPHSQ